MKKFHFLLLFFFIFSNGIIFSQNKNLIAFVENSSDNKPIPSVHVINLNQVIGVITDSKGKFEIPAKLNDTLYLSYLGYKSIKVRVTNDLLKFENSKIQLTELAYALEEVIVKPYQLTGYLEIDAKNVPVSKSYRYSIPGLPTRGYEGGSRNSGAFSKVINAIFNYRMSSTMKNTNIFGFSIFDIFSRKLNHALCIFNSIYVPNFF